MLKFKALKIVLSGPLKEDLVPLYICIYIHIHSHTETHTIPLMQQHNTARNEGFTTLTYKHSDCDLDLARLTRSKFYLMAEGQDICNTEYMPVEFFENIRKNP